MLAMLNHLKSSRSPIHATPTRGTRTHAGAQHSPQPREAAMLDNPAGGGGMPLPPEPMMHPPMHEGLPTMHQGRGAHGMRTGTSPMKRGGVGF